MTLFGVHPDDLKACVYTMRFDEASARYAEFGPFCTGMVARSRRCSTGREPLGPRADVIGDAAPSPRSSVRLARWSRAWAGLVVAFSGGADSGFLAHVATDVLGPDRVLCVTAVSPSLAPEELADCRALAAEWGLRWRTVSTPTSWTTRPTRPTTRTAATTARRPCWTSSRRWPRRGRRRGPRASTSTISATTVPARAAAAERGALPPRGRRASPRPTCAPRRAGWACGPGTSRRRPAWPRACPTAPRSPSEPSPRWRGRVRAAGARIPPAPGAPLRRPGAPRARR